MAVILKIATPDGVTKAMRFVPNSTVLECLVSVKEKRVPEMDVKLFALVQERSGAPDLFLKPEKTLQYYDLKTEDKLKVVKKHALLKVQLIDGTVKTVLVDWSVTVSEVTDVIAGKMNIINPEEYSLQTLPQESKRVPLDGRKSLWENDVVDDEQLVLRVG